MLAGDEAQLDEEGKEQGPEYWAAAARAALADYDVAKEQHAVRLQVADSELKAVMEAGDQVAPPVRYGAAVEAKVGSCESILRAVKQGNKLAKQRGLSRTAWAAIWDSLGPSARQELWNRGNANLFDIIDDTLTSQQRGLVARANIDNARDGALAYVLLRRNSMEAQRSPGRRQRIPTSPSGHKTAAARRVGKSHGPFTQRL